MFLTVAVALGLLTVAPPAEPSAPDDAVSGAAVFGRCADQGPLIGGDVLARLLVATPPAAQVVGLTVRSDGAAIREIEIPYYGWEQRIEGDAMTAMVEGVPDPVEHFWFWIALVDVDADEIVIDVEATLLDGTVVRHSSAPGAADHPALRIPVDRARLPEARPEGAGALAPTPMTGQEPCRIGSYPASTVERPVTRLPVSYDDGLPAWVLAGIGGALFGIGMLLGLRLGRRP